jgi:hypothetical protein
MRNSWYYMLCSVLVAALATVAASSNPPPAETWPGFRGHAMSGVAPSATLPERWSATET